MIKYKIIEYCLGHAIDTITKNLNIHKLNQVPLDSFYKGLFLSRMEFYGYVAHNCTITEYEIERDSSNGEVWHHIDFKCSNLEDHVPTEIAVTESEQESGDFRAYL